MTIEVLTVTDCPHAESAVANVRAALQRTGAMARIVHIVVLDGDAARQLRFPGSPTIRVDGDDVDCTTLMGEWGLACRVYRDGTSVTGTPPVTLIEDAICAHR